MNENIDTTVALDIVISMQQKYLVEKNFDESPTICQFHQYISLAINLCYMTFWFYKT